MNLNNEVNESVVAYDEYRGNSISPPQIPPVAPINRATARKIEKLLFDLTTNFKLFTNI